MRFPFRRVVFGFVIGAAAGWVAGLFRTPKPAPDGSSAWEPEPLPQEHVGDPAPTAPAAPEPPATKQPAATKQPIRKPPAKKATPARKSVSKKPTPPPQE